MPKFSFKITNPKDLRKKRSHPSHSIFHHSFETNDTQEIELEPSETFMKKTKTELGPDDLLPELPTCLNSPDEFLSEFSEFQEKLEMMIPSLVLLLHSDHFLFENQQIPYPYDRSTKVLLDAIDEWRLLPDLEDLLEGHPRYYYWGCLVVEIRDFRCSSPKPIVKRAMLRPILETTINDVERILRASNKEWSQEDALQIEHRLLLTTAPPLCLEQSPTIFSTVFLQNFNRMKFEYKSPLSVRLNHLVLSSSNEERPKPRTERFRLLKFLKQKAQESPTPPTSFLPLVQQVFNLAISRSTGLPHSSSSFSSSSSSSIRNNSNNTSVDVAALLKRGKTQFSLGNSGLMCFLEVLPKKVGFDGTMRIGKTEQTAESIRFALGNAEQAEAFVNQLLIEFEKEGRALSEKEFRAQ